MLVEARLNARSTIAIIGGGFSGTLQAINLLRHQGPRAILIERREPQLARGVAYSAADASHLLNVRAANMSAFPDDPGHFVRWLDGRNGAGLGGGFVPRSLYGEYLQALLAAAAASAPERLEILSGDAHDLGFGGQGVVVHLSDGRDVAADAAVLAPGNLPPHSPPGIDDAALGADVFATDPWASDIAEDLGPGDTVMLLGTGLTAVDAALLLDARGFRGNIVALSRRGLVPHAHSTAPRNAAEIVERPPAAASALVKFMRERALARGWQDAVDDLRPMTQLIWAAASDADRARFLRHLRPYWDIHRHRLAPQVAEKIGQMRAEGRLQFLAGKILASRVVPKGVELKWRLRGSDLVRCETVRRVVNCTGPQGDLLRTDEPLLRNLLTAGEIVPDAMRLGLAVDQDSRVVRADGSIHGALFAIGPMTRGGLWEIVAVPDLRQQSWSLARRLSNAHWVGGEGL